MLQKERSKNCTTITGNVQGEKSLKVFFLSLHERRNNLNVKMLLIIFLLAFVYSGGVQSR